MSNNLLKLRLMEKKLNDLVFFMPKAAIEFDSREEFLGIEVNLRLHNKRVPLVMPPVFESMVWDIFENLIWTKKDALEKGYTIVPFAEFMEANTKPEEAPSLPAKNLEGVQVGDRLFHALTGGWVDVVAVEPLTTFGITVVIKGIPGFCYFTLRGFITEGEEKSGGLPVLYFSRPEFEYPTRPVPEVVYEVDKPICYKETRFAAWKVGVLLKKVGTRYWIYGRNSAVFEVKPFEDWKSENLNQVTDENDD